MGAVGVVEREAEDGREMIRRWKAKDEGQLKASRRWRVKDGEQLGKQKLLN